ncbi:MAG: hypothetical protein ACRC5A_01990 [Enterobacteriaceae bacterium]
MKIRVIMSVPLLVFPLLSIAETVNTDNDYSIGGEVSCYFTKGLTLENNRERLDIPSGKGAFTFDHRYPSGTAYDVEVKNNPDAFLCQAENNKGTVNTSDVDSVKVSCHLDPSIPFENSPQTDPQANVVNIQFQNISLPTDKFYNQFNYHIAFAKLSPSPVGTRFTAVQFAAGGPKGSDTLYIGINPPQQDESYDGQVHFSYFGTRGILPETHPHCRLQADYGDGITCELNYRAVPGHLYSLTVQAGNRTSDDKTLWIGSIQDLTRGSQPIEIGRFYLQDLQGIVPNSAISWVEGSSDPCSALVATDMFLSPITYYLGHTEYQSDVSAVAGDKCGAHYVIRKNAFMDVRYGGIPAVD